MLPDKASNTNIGVGLGFIAQAVGLVLSRTGGSPALSTLGSLLLLASIPLFIWGCMNYAEGKGYSKWLGLLGILGIIGLVILVLLPDHHKTA